MGWFRPSRPALGVAYASGTRAARGLNLPRARGVALITVMLIVFLASVLAVNLATLQQFAIRRSALIQHQQQARLYALGAEQWAAVILERDALDNKTDHPGEDWAKLPPALPVEGGVVAGRIKDLQGCFNLNNLLRAAVVPADGDGQPRTAPPAPAQDTDALDRDQLRALERLLENLDIDPAIALAIADWLDPDQEPTFPSGAEDDAYTTRDPPYLAANGPLFDLSELRLIAGIDDALYTKLAPYVCVLPPGTSLNINAAPMEVIRAAIDSVDGSAIDNLIKNRGAAGFTSVDAFLANARPGPNALPKTKLAVASRYFLVEVEARVGDSRALLQSVLERGKGSVRTLSRSFGEVE